MVFESVVVDLLNRFLGDYVENLNSNQLKVGIWGGDVVLENLSLKHSVLEELDLPLRVASGNLGKLALKIPWQNLYSAPVVVTIDSLYLILIPSQEVVFDPLKEEKWAQDAKQAALQKVEAAKKRESDKNLPKPDDTFVEKLAVQIIKNVQVKIVDIHIRYEDRITRAGDPFAFGITMHNLSIQTTNSNWEETFVDQPASQFFKVLYLEGLAIYWNCSSKLIWSSEDTTSEEIQEQCKAGIYTKDYTPDGYRYIVGPINSTLKLLMNPKPELANYVDPKVQISWELQNLSMGISKSQYQDVILLGESLDNMSRAAPYRKYRPNLTRYTGNYKEWWKFAYICILEEDIRRVRHNWNWERMLKHRNRSRKYAVAYRNKITSKKPSEETLMICAEAEKYMDVLNIILVRQKVEMEVATSEQTTTAKKTETGWFGGWWGGGSGSKRESDLLSAAAIAKKFESMMSPEEKKKLYQAIDYEENAGKAFFPETYVDLSLAFNLPALVMEVRDDVYDNPRVLFAELSGVEITFGSRPAVSAIALGIKMRQFTVYGMQQGDFLPQLVGSKGLDPNGDYLVTFLFETQPLDKLCDQRIKLFSRPLEIVFDSGTINKLTDVFTPPQASYAITQLQAVANSKLKNFKEMSALGLQYAIDNHSTLELNVNLQSSYLIIPYKGMFQGKEDLIVINLGNISMKSVIRDPGTPNIQALFQAGTTEDDIMRRMMAQSYDRFVIRIEEMQVVMAMVGEEWQKVVTGAGQNTPLHILTPTLVIIELDRCVIQDDPRMPKLKMAVKLPSLLLVLADVRLLHLLSISASLNSHVEDEELTASQDGSQHTSLSVSTRAEYFPDSLKNRDSKPWLKLNEYHKNVIRPDVTKVINVELKFELPEFRVSLHRVRKHKGGTSDISALNRVLLFRLLKLEVHMVQSTIDMDVEMKLGRVSIDVPDSNGEVRLLETPKATGQVDYLFSINYNKESKYHKHTGKSHDEQSVTVLFSSLNIHLHQEALVMLMVYVEAFTQHLDNAVHAAPSSVRTSVQHQRLSIVGELDLAHSKTKLKPRAPQRLKQSRASINLVFFRFKASLSTITVSILRRRKSLSKIAIRGCFTEMLFRASRTEITARIVNLSVQDMNPMSEHPMIVSVVGEEMLLAEITLHNNNVIKHVPVEHPDMSVTAEIACIRFVYLNSFVGKLLHFINSFQATKERVFEAAVEAAFVAKQNMKDNQTSKILLAFSFQAPIIVMPIHLKSFSGIVLDFGKLGIINKITTIKGEKEDTLVAIVDEMTVTLENLKISRVKLNRDYTIRNECSLLQPVTFNIMVKRNLSSPWYNVIADTSIEGMLQDLHMTFTEEDVKLVMRVLSENIGYVEELPPIDAAITGGPTASVNKSRKSAALGSRSGTSRADFERRLSSRHRKESQQRMSEIVPIVQADPFECKIKMTNFILDLYNGGIKILDDESIRNEAENKSSLGRFSVHELNAQCLMKASGRQMVNLWLANLLLEDTRQSQTGQITTLMQRKDCEEFEDPNAGRYMIHFEYIQEKEEKTVNLRVYRFDLILSLEYLMRLAAFISNGLGGNNEVEQQDSDMSLTGTKALSVKTGSTLVKKSVSKPSNMVKSQQPLPETKEMLTLNLALEKPDIILVESMADLDTNCLVLNCELAAKIRFIGTHQVLNASIQNLQLFSCSYNPDGRHSGKALILHPCNIYTAGSTPADSGLHLDVNVSDIRLGVSPGTIEILNKVYQAVYGSVAPPKAQDEEVVNYSQLWTPETFSEEDFWFFKTEVGEEVTEDPHTEEPAQDSSQVAVKPKQKKEICILTVPCIALTIEAGVGKQTLPMVKMDMSINAVVKNWSSEMDLESTVCLKMSYYNSRLALWEPLIEPAEYLEDGEERSWTIKTTLMMNKPSPPIDLEMSLDDSSIAPTPLMTILLLSDDNLELTLTKTCISVFSQLAEAFRNAVTAEGWSQKVALRAPFVVKNDTGLPLMITLKDSPFQPQNVRENQDYEQALLHTNSELGLALKDMTEDGQVAWNNTRSKSKRRNSLEIGPDELTTVQAREMFLNIKLMSGSSTLEAERSSVRLGVVRAEKRFFDLKHRGDDKEPWGLVSHVKIIAGCSLITLRGIVQITNHFHTAVTVYYMTPRGNEVQCIGTIEPDSEMNVPLTATYTLTGELFFSVKHYAVSEKPFVWKTLKNLVATTELIQCQPKTATEKSPFFIKVVGEMEQVYYEHTTRHTMQSTLYNIHLRPAVVLKNLLPVDIEVQLDRCVLRRKVNAGEIIQLPTAEPGVTSLVLEIINYLDKDWVCAQPVQWNAPAFTTCSFLSRDSYARVALDLGLHTQYQDGTTSMALYCPFWMINKTGVSITYRKSRKIDRAGTPGSSSSSPTKSDDASNILPHPFTNSGPILFSFKPKSFFGKKKAAIRVGTGEWSDKFSLDVAGSSGIVRCKTADVIYQIGVNIQLTHFTLTKLVTFTPFYVLINNAHLPIQVQEAERPADPWTEVTSGSCCALWPINDKEKLLRVRISGTRQVTAPFSYAAPHTTLLPLANVCGGVNVDVQITDSSIYMTFCLYAPGLAPALLVNHTSMPIKYREKMPGRGKDKEGVCDISILEPGHMVLMTWLHSLGPRKITWNLDHEEVTYDMRKDGLGEFKQSAIESEVFWVSFLNGIQRVLLFTPDPMIASRAQSSADMEVPDKEVNLSFAGLGISLVNNEAPIEVLYVTVSSSGICWESRKGRKFKAVSVEECHLLEVAYQKYCTAESTYDEFTRHEYNKAVITPHMEVDFHTMCILKPAEHPLRRTHYVGLWVRLLTSLHQMQLHAKINRIQIDCQMVDNVFPVVLAPVPPPKSVALKAAARPFAEVSIVRRISEYSSLQQYKYFKFLIQEFHIKLDIGLINALVVIFAAEELTAAEEAALFLRDRELISEPLMAHVSLKAYQDHKDFYDFLHFSPLKIHLSFSLSSGGQKAKQEMPMFLNVLMQSLGVTLTDVQDVVFKLGYFEREHMFLTQNQLISAAQSHYLSQAVKQLYVLVLGLDVLGNPYGLVLGLTQGVEDLFYEPFQGAIQGPGEFAEGLVLGVRSLLGHTVGGAAGAASRITGAMGKGLAALTFDKDFQRKRREALNQRHANVQAGLAHSSKGLVMGVVDGVSGVFTKPIAGAKEDGVAGFFTGMGKGVMGLVTRPTAGVIDFASGSLDAVKRAAELNEEVTRRRLPRFFHQDGQIRAYSASDAVGNKLLHDLDKGRYVPTDVYVSHIELGKDTCLLTDRRMMYITHGDVFGRSLAWSCTWESLKEMPILSETGIIVIPAREERARRGIFGSSDGDKRFIEISNKAAKERFYKRILLLLKPQ